jgi:hypothetical protein
MSSPYSVTPILSEIINWSLYNVYMSMTMHALDAFSFYQVFTEMRWQSIKVTLSKISKEYKR